MDMISTITPNYAIQSPSMPSNQKQPLQESTSIVVVERTGLLHVSHINEYSQTELCKKCKYKSPSGFDIRAEWAYSGPDSDRFIVELWAREDGNAGQENKYEFPPPVDTILFFGTCALVAKDMSSQHRVIPLTLEKWDKMYNFLFGGFDTLVNCEDEDEFEEDELDAIPASRKTKDGYLKDGFVVDNSDEDDEDDDDDDDEDDDADDEPESAEDEDEDEESTTTDDDESEVVNKLSNKKVLSKKTGAKKCNKINKQSPKEEPLIDTTSELSEESYEYFDD
jgi:hypothetical protein